MVEGEWLASSRERLKNNGLVEKTPRRGSGSEVMDYLDEGVVA